MSKTSWNGVDITYKVDEHGCWICTSHIPTFKGYYNIKRNGRAYKMHRYILILKLGREIGDGLLACHSCNNKKCINPDHIYEGTSLDNSKDMVKAGTARGGYMPGETNPNSTLTNDIVFVIKNSPELTISDLARELGVAYNTIWKIRKGITWRHIV